MKIIVTEGTLLEKAVWGWRGMQGLWMGREGLQRGPKKSMGIMDMFIILTLMMVSPYYSCENILFYFKYVQAIVGLLYFNKVFF